MKRGDVMGGAVGAGEPVEALAPLSGEKAKANAVNVESPDEVLVRRAMKDIKAILGRTLQKGLEEVGTYILEHFYGNDLELYRSTAPSKHASLSLLVAKCDTMELPVSKTFLSNAVRVAVTATGLPATAKFRALPASYQIELARVPDADKLEQLAERASKNDMDVRKLRQLVAKTVNGTGGGKGRPARPNVLRALERAAAFLRRGDTWHLGFKKEDIEALDDDEQKELREIVSRLTDLLAKLEKLLPD
jgi:hypothetical protein